MEAENTNKVGEGKIFEISITNGAAKRLQSLIDHFEGDETRVVSLALELLDLIKDSEKIEFKNKGELESRGLIIPKTLKLLNKE